MQLKILKFRRSMGLPPTTQGHNNLRLMHTTNSYQNFRLDTNLHTLNKTKQNNFNRFLPTTMPQYYTQAHTPFQNPYPQQMSHPLHQQYPMRTYPPAQPSHFLLQKVLHHGNLPSYQPAQHIRFNELPQNLMRLRKGEHHSPRITYGDRTRKTILKPMSSRIVKNAHSSMAALNLQHKSTHSYAKRHPIVSNMPLINVNSSILLVNHSPFGLTEPQFGILHHCAQSISYF